MRVSAKAKADIIEQFRRAADDTGSPEVQIAMLSVRIGLLTEHLKQHKKDFHSRRGLIRMVNRRRSLLTYLKRVDMQRYSSVVQNLGLRG